VGSPEGDGALARNVAAGIPAALAFTGAAPVAAVAMTGGGAADGGESASATTGEEG
jgi:hypothetical protein